MLRALISGFFVLMAATIASAATLTITPDKSVYLVGEEITLSVVGDSEGAAAQFVEGRINFSPQLANFASSQQELLTSFGGLLTWQPLLLLNGTGFADVFGQVVSVNPETVDGLLFATLVLEAAAPGTLDYSWDENLDFFRVEVPPGGSVTIIPEPTTAFLVATGLVGLSIRGRRRRGGVRGPAIGRASIPLATIIFSASPLQYSRRHERVHRLLGESPGRPDL